MAGCLSIAIIFKAILIIAFTILMMWLLWACADACQQAAAILPLLR